MISLQQILQSIGRPTATTSAPVSAQPSGAYTAQVDPLTGRSLPPLGSQAPLPNPYAGYNPALNSGAFADKKFIDGPGLTLNPNGPWDFIGTDYAPPPPPEYGLLPPPRSLISPWDTAPAQRYNTYTNVYGQQFTTPQQINLSRFSSSPSGNLPLYMNQDIANILSTALGY